MSDISFTNTEFLQGLAEISQKLPQDAAEDIITTELTNYIDKNLIGQDESLDINPEERFCKIELEARQVRNLRRSKQRVLLHDGPLYDVIATGMHQLMSEPKDSARSLNVIRKVLLETLLPKQRDYSFSGGTYSGKVRANTLYRDQLVKLGEIR